jgi:hypothetical protein
MHASRSFLKLNRSAHRRLARIKAIAKHSTSGSSFDARIDRDIGFAVVEIQNLWTNFSRAYLVCCVVGAKRKSTGRVTLADATITTPGAMIHAAAKVARGPHAAAPTSRREEPSWHEVRILLKTCESIQCSHLADVQRALSLQTRVFSDLPVFRNFYAHRNEETAERALNLAQRQYLITKAKTPTEAITSRVRRRPQPLLLDWIDEMDTVMDLLCE